jgi:predicted RNA-binding Zn-ribbon protein involved in translation (DUF1610 family)
MSYESSLASGWEAYSEDAYTIEVSVDDPCEDCGWQPPKGMTTMASLESRNGGANWDCPNCEAHNWFDINYGYDDIAEDKAYDL